MLEKLKRISEHLSALSEELNTTRIELAALAKEPNHTEGTATNTRSSLAAIGSFLQLSPGMPEDDLFTTLLKCAMYVTGAGGAGLTLYDHQKERLVFRAALGDGAERIIGFEVPLEGSVHGLAFATGEVQSRTPLHREVDEVTKVTFRNVLVAPLIVNDEGLGTMSAVNKQKGDHFTQEDMEAYRLFADLTAQVVSRQRRDEMLKRIFKGEDVTLPAGLENIQCNKSDLLRVKISEDIGSLSEGREHLLPLLNRLTELIVELSKHSGWRW